ncbi:MAG TPA: adenylate/guanylate cyclase domain-containing protein [Ornithinibacter sp.]|nr:adenylate/guanylate cyclase domain-containing protein [Ornithinibacter sp.]
MPVEDLGLPAAADEGTATGADAGAVEPSGLLDDSGRAAVAPDDVAERVERMLLGRPASMGRREVSEGAGVEPVTARRFWHAMGFQNVGDEDAMFTEADTQALSRVARIISEGRVSEDLALGMTRAFARTADRLAVWQTQLVAESLTSPFSEELEGRDSRSVPEPQVAAEAAELLAGISTEIEPLLVYVWRRHLTNAIARMLADADPAVHSDPSAPIRVVGFADLVSFTSFVRRMSERQLARLVQRFELLASDVITEHGGRVIKTVGDEVLFVHTEAAAASAIALDLVDAMAEDELLPPVRVGLAHGRVVSRLGDVFGMTVNKASRITAVTPSGHVYVDDDMARVLGEVSGFSAIERRRRILRGIGVVTLHELQRAPGGRRPPPSEGSA